MGEGKQNIKQIAQDVKTRSKWNKVQLEANKKHFENLSNKQLKESQINMPTKRLKFIPTPEKG